MGAAPPTRRVAVTTGAVVVIVLIAAAVVWGLTRGGSDDGRSAGRTTGTSLTPTTPSGNDSAPPTSLGTPSSPGTGATVPDGAVRTRPAVPIGHRARWGSGISVRIASITSVHGQATQPGEVSGPAIRVRLVATNSSRKPQSLDSAVVSAFYGADRTPALELSSGEHRFGGRLAPGRSAHATYVFTVPPGERGDLRFEVSLTPAQPTVAFHGHA